jgi:hypothetical protein
MRKPARQVALASAVLATSILMPGARAAAQRPASSDATAAAALRVAGVVLDSGGAAVPFADVRLAMPDGRRFASSSDETGRFRFSGLPPGPARVEVRRIGFRPYAQEIVVAETEAATGMRILLAVAAAQLTGIEVSDSRDETDPALTGFYSRRRSNNFGHYLDRSQIEATHAQRASEALRTVPGVLVQPSRRVGNVVRVRNCRPTVWLDGVRLPGVELDEVTTVDDVAAVEIYKSLAGLPQQFIDRTNPCGAILVWSRTH